MENRNLINRDSFKKINNDINGNPRYVCAWYSVLTQSEMNEVKPCITRVKRLYRKAIDKMRQFGGKQYRGKDFGGGIVLQAYNLNELVDSINSTL